MKQPAICRTLRGRTIAALLVAALCGCQGGDGAKPASVTSASVLADLRLSTSVPPLLAAPPQRQAQAPLAEPIIVRRVQPAMPSGAGKATPVGDTGTISLNFEKASLRAVIDSVLGDALGVAYSVDERVDGVVTLVSPQKLDREQALDVLDGLLRMNGAALIKGDKLYRVVLAANARQNLPGPRSGTDMPGYAVSVYLPRHTAAASLQKLIEPLYQIAGALSADSEHNLLLITGNAEERRALTEAARLFDQDWLANQSVGIFPLHQARPRQLVDELKALFAQGGAAAGGEPASIRFSAIERLGAVMVVSLQPGGLDRAQEWITRLDQTGVGERSLHVYPVHYAKVQTIAKLLGRLFTADGGTESGSAALPPGVIGTRFTTPGSPAPASSPSLSASSGASQATGDSFGSTDHGSSNDAGQAEAEIGGEPGNGARVIADPASHSLLVIANQAEAGMIEEALAVLDARPAQVLIEATIVEVTLNKNLQYGVQYFLRGGKLLGQPDSSVGFNSSSLLGPLQGIAPGFNGVLGSLGNPSVIVSALDQVTDTKVLSSPQLLVADSHEALLKVGTQTPLLTQQATSTSSLGAPTVNSVEYHDTGVILRVLPRTNEAGMVSMDITQEVSEVVANATNALTPSIELRRIESSVTIQSGQTVVLGGLIAENNSVSRSGLPPFSGIPILGAIFGNQTDSRIRTELIVFITPHILRDGDEARRLTEELMGRLSSMRPSTP